jgi:hypothetical protein
MFSTENHSSSNFLHSRVRQEIEVMHIQEPTYRSGGPPRSPSLNCTAILAVFNEYSTADAALLLEIAASIF